jgi:hypothetical protein
VPEPSASEIEVAIGKLKSYKPPSADQFLAQLIQAGGEILRSEIHKRMKLTWKNEKLPHQRKESIFILIHKKSCDGSNCRNYRVIYCCQLHIKFIQHSPL